MTPPVRALLLLFYITCICTVIMVISPKKILFGENMTFDVFSFKDIEVNRGASSLDSSAIARVDSLQIRIDSMELAMKEMERLDSLALIQAKDSSKRREEVAEVVRPAKQAIEFPKDKPEILDKFFASLQGILDNGDLVRILHYGDSQIEGDRISKYLRNRFQARFGGCGLGLVPVKARGRIRSTIFTDYSPNWKKYAYIDSKNKPFHNKLGLLAAYYRFTPRLNEGDSLKEMQHAWVQYKDPHLSYRRATEIENMKVLYRNPKEKLAIEAVIDGEVVAKKDLDISENLGVFQTDIKTNFDKAKIYFGSKGEPDILGVAFDCNEGIAFDNVAIRGSSGTEFSKLNRNFLAEQIKTMKIKLLIVQFGVNVVPNVLDTYGWYERAFYRQLNYFKSLNPDLNVIVVGVSDMAHKEEGQFRSYPNIEKIRNAQRNAAFKANCAFWDFYAAMGGKNAMVSWVRAKPSLATEDYTHLNSRGAKLVGEMLYRALMTDYEAYKKRKKSL
jgi:lysophospholipase L1-like esterase